MRERIRRDRHLTAEEAARLREARAEFASRPSESQLLASGEYVGPMSIEEFMNWREGAGSAAGEPASGRHCRLRRTYFRDCCGERRLGIGGSAFCQRAARHHAGSRRQDRRASWLGPRACARRVTLMLLPARLRQLAQILQRLVQLRRIRAGLPAAAVATGEELQFFVVLAGLQAPPGTRTQRAVQ